MRIGEILKNRGYLTDADIEAILRRQVVHGGRFGTCAVEIKALDLDALAEALGEQRGLPAATARHFGRADNAVLRRIGDTAAAEFRAIPLGYLRKDPPEIAVAVGDPLDPAALAALASALEADVVQAIAPELRILYYLEAVYGIERLPRFRRSPSGRNETEPGADRRRYVRTLSDEGPPQPPAALAKISVRRIVVNADQPPRLDTISGGIRAVRGAMGRDRVGDYVVGTLREAFDAQLRAGIIFGARDGLLLGWKGFVRDGYDSTIESLALEIDRPSMLRDPFLGGVSVFGEPAPTELDRKLWAALGLGAPSEIAVVPVVLRREVAALIYADAAEPLEASAVGGLAELGQSLAAAFDRLVKAAER
jgi:hypothetical protein